MLHLNTFSLLELDSTPGKNFATAILRLPLATSFHAETADDFSISGSGLSPPKRNQSLHLAEVSGEH